MYLLLGCVGPADIPPATLDEMSAALLVTFEEDDADGIAQSLADWLVTNVDASDGYALNLLTADEPSEIQPQPTIVDVAAMIGVGTTHRVVAEVDQLVAIAPEKDQSFSDPESYPVWDRTIAQGSAASFVAGGSIRTDNQIQQDLGLGLVINYPMRVDYRWIQLTQGDSVIFRSWPTDAGCTDDGLNCLKSGFSVDIWVPDPGGLIWYDATWVDLTSAVDDVLSEDFMRNELIAGTITWMDGSAAHARGE